MSEKGVQILKLLVRGFVGLIALYFVLILGLMGSAISLVGIIAILFCWLPFVYPDIIRTTFPVNGELVTNDPIITVALIVLIGIVCLSVGYVSLKLSIALGKKAISFDSTLDTYMSEKITKYSSNARIRRLEKLGTLYENKVITEQEFEQEKARILQEYPTKN